MAAQLQAPEGEPDDRADAPGDRLGLAGVLEGRAVMTVQHVVMIPAMLGVMLARYDRYAR